MTYFPRFAGLLLVFLGCKSLNHDDHLQGLQPNEEKILDYSPLQLNFIIQSGLIETSFTNIRNIPSTKAPAEVISSVTNYQFPLAVSLNPQEDLVEQEADNYKWRKIILNQEESESAWVAVEERKKDETNYRPRSGIVFTVGYIALDPNETYNLREEKTTQSKPLGLLKGSLIFDVVEVSEVTQNKKTLTWYKVLLKNLPNHIFGYIAQAGNIKFQQQPSVNLPVTPIPVLRNQKCEAGFAQVGWLKSEQVLFANNKIGEVLTQEIGTETTKVFLPRGTKVKIVQPPIITNGLVKIEAQLFNKTGILPQDQRQGFIRRSEVSISNSCQPFGVDLITQGDYTLLGATDYVSKSSVSRRTNIALAFSRLDGQIIKTQEEFSLLPRIVFPYEGNNIQAPYLDELAINAGESFIDKDQLGCPPGFAFNPDEPISKLGNCKAFVPGVSTTLEPIYAGGLCGVSTALHKAVTYSGLPVIYYHNHRQFFSGVYGVPDTVYNTLSVPGVDAEVYWGTIAGEQADNSGYRFLNDSKYDVVILSSAIYVPGNDDTHGTIQLWIKSPNKDRDVVVSEVKQIARDPKFVEALPQGSNLGVKTCWKSEVTYLQSPRPQPISRSNIRNIITDNKRTQITHNMYAQAYKSSESVEILCKDKDNNEKKVKVTIYHMSKFAVDCSTGKHKEDLKPEEYCNMDHIDPNLKIECLPRAEQVFNLDECMDGMP